MKQMEVTKKIIAIESLIIILLCLFLFNQCRDKKVITPEVKTRIVTERKYYPKWNTLVFNHYYKRDSLILQPKQLIDTGAILEHYFSQFTFADSLRDTNISIQSRVVVALNTVIKSDIKYKLLHPITSTTVTIETKTEIPKRAMLLFGGTIGGNKNQFISTISPNLLLITKKYKGFGIGYDVVNQTYQGSFYLPILK